ncbi:MAG TPA: hypothetical protein VK826_03350 [Bacteroidia bacterium]|nr:hypothetical protein [Bacteroidia bacterium]
MKNTGKLSLLIVILVAFSLRANGQTLAAEAVLVPNTIRIGEQCTLKLFVRYTEGSMTSDVRWPRINDSLAENITVLESDTVVTELVDRASVLYQQKNHWIITSFDSGTWIIPSVPFVVNGDTAWTNPVELNVNTVPVDTLQPIKDIAGIYDVPPPPEIAEAASDKMWWWIGGALVIIAVAITLFFLLKKKKQEPVAPVPVGRVLLPHEIILQKLSSMATHKPWREDIKAHYVELSELMREWLVERFHLPAREMTTYEIMMRLRRAPDSGNKTSELEHVFKTADLVKFGKSVPDEYISEKCIEHAIEFVMSTSFTTVHIPPPNTFPG